jgi:hypothetical protein
MFPGVAVRTLPFPKLELISPDNVSQNQNQNPIADLVFTGYPTKYRSVLLKQLETRISVTYPGTFMSRREMDNLNRSARLALNIPQRKDWKWLSLMRVLAALRCGRATISLGTSDSSKISSCCKQLDITQLDWVENLREYICHWDTTYRNAYENYVAMAFTFEKEKPFPNDLFDYWAVSERCAIGNISS